MSFSSWFDYKRLSNSNYIRSQQQRNLTNAGENERGVITMYWCCRPLWNDDIYSNQRKGTLQNIKREDEDKDKDSGGRESQQARSQHAQFSTEAVSGRLIGGQRHARLCSANSKASWQRPTTVITRRPVTRTARGDTCNITAINLK